MQLDVRTIVYLTAIACAVGALLLAVSWRQNREQRSLAWWAAAYAACSVGCPLVALRDVIPDRLSIDIGNAVLLLGVGLMWAGARIFDSRPPRPWVIAGGAILWLILCRIPEFHQVFPVRAGTFSVLLSLYSAAIAAEFWRGRSDRLASRFVLVALFSIHAAAHAVRAGIAANVAPPGEFIEPGLWFVVSVVASFMLVTGAGVLVVAIAKERAEQVQRQAAMIDPLTGSWNRRALFEQGARLVQRARRDGIPVSVLVMDLDRFKQVNDRHGHAAGDRVLQQFCELLRTTLRAGDFHARLGGEEFAAVLPGADGRVAEQVGERIRDALSDCRQEPGHVSPGVTVSIGVAELDGCTDTFEGLLDTADRALYEAKSGGRDQVRLAPATEPV